MEKNIKIMLGVLVVLVVVAVVFSGGLTGSAVTRYCSDIPEITNLEQVGDSIAVNWKDTSKYSGDYRYEVYLYKQLEDGSYDLEDYLDIVRKDKPYLSFVDVDDGTFLVKIRAQNDRSCEEEFTEYSEQEIVIET